jgi:DNA-binding transcriptional regulator YbjK
MPAALGSPEQLGAERLAKGPERRSASVQAALDALAVP